MKNKVEIRSHAPENGIVKTEIFINGNQITGVRSFELKQDTESKIPILKLDLNVFDLSVDFPFLKINQNGIGEIKSISFKNGKTIKVES